MQIQLHKDRVITPWSTAIAAAIPETRQVHTPTGRHLAVVPHGSVETVVLRNLGFEVPAPILSQYDWAGSTPFDSQKVTAAMLTLETRAYCLSSMGVGKTRATMYAFDFLRKTSDIGPALIVAPLSTLADVWAREVFEIFHHMHAVVLHGTKAQRLKLLESEADVYIINHDGVGVILDELIKKNFGVVVIDELGAYRNAQTARWKIMNSLINKGRTTPVPCWGLTGSPTPNAPTDAYGLSKLLTPWRVPRSFRAFQQSTMEQISQFRWIPKPNANETAANALRPSVRFSLDECHDLPPITFSTRHVDMTNKQRELYERISEKFTAEFKSKQINAVNEGAKLQKLLQVSSGFAYAEDKGLYVDAKDRMALVLEIIEQASKKVLVFANFSWVVEALHLVVSSKFTCAKVNGDVSKAARDTIFAGFRRSKDPHVIVADARTMAHGLNLIEADTIIWYGPTMSAEVYEQANARIRRPGQKHKTHVVHIESTPVEKRAFSRLKNRQKMQGLLLEMLQGEHTD